MKFTTAIQSRTRRIDADECHEIAKAFRIDDQRSSYISAASAFLFQFFAHWGWDSDGDANRYDGKADGRFGAYPLKGKGAGTVDDKTGKFLIHEAGHLPTISTSSAPGKVEVTPDLHRANENRILTAFHLLHANLHNKLVDVGMTYDEAKDHAVAIWARVFENSAMDILHTDDRDWFRRTTLKDFNLSKEWVFAVGRFGHPMMPDTVLGEPLFSKDMFSNGVDMHALLREKAGAIGMRIGEAMHTGSMGGDPDSGSILDKTLMDKHFQFELASFQDAFNVLRRTTKNAKPIQYPNCPLFAGMLAEADQSESEGFGPIGSRMIADGISGSLAYGQPSKTGLWFNLGTEYPRKLEDLITYVYGPSEVVAEPAPRPEPAPVNPISAGAADAGQSPDDGDGDGPAEVEA